MVKSIDVERFLGIPYRLENGPGCDDYLNGINCQGLLDILYSELFGVSLPQYPLSQEVNENTDLFENINDGAGLQQGDVFLFGKLRTPSEKFHLAVFIDRDTDDEPLLLHSNPYDGVSIWRLEDFFKKPRYSQLKGIKRLKKYES